MVMTLVSLPLSAIYAISGLSGTSDFKIISTAPGKVTAADPVMVCPLSYVSTLEIRLSPLSETPDGLAAPLVADADSVIGTN